MKKKFTNKDFHDILLTLKENIEKLPEENKR